MCAAVAVVSTAVAAEAAVVLGVAVARVVAARSYERPGRRRLPGVHAHSIL